MRRPETFSKNLNDPWLYIYIYIIERRPRNKFVIINTANVVDSDIFRSDRTILRVRLYILRMGEIVKSQRTL